MTTLFVSDLHLDEQRPDITRLFCRFLADQAARASALYILGDLFEAWIGDDDPGAVGDTVALALSALAVRGVPCSFIHGNRDFLLGQAYAARAGMRLLPDPSVIMLGGQPVLISHGDALCTADLAYQQVRQQTRDAAWREAFLAQVMPFVTADDLSTTVIERPERRWTTASMALASGSSTSPRRSRTRRQPGGRRVSAEPRPRARTRWECARNSSVSPNWTRR